MKSIIKRLVMNLYCAGWLSASAVNRVFNRLDLGPK